MYAVQMCRSNSQVFEVVCIANRVCVSGGLIGCHGNGRAVIIDGARGTSGLSPYLV